MTFTLDEYRIILDAFHAQRSELSRKLLRLEKSAGGRNHRANEAGQNRLREQLRELELLFRRVNDSRLAVAELSRELAR